ncbi:hypothetical protein Glove_508g84 [Diversispora epigaea]|uniref:Uncharacterized protein n=1 Tax=Diversispora epigaea TaxID=1348612 RepID=A0A397GLL6_9GLOM|nr:hypothetical protein Glove_508g84 [Diversispora epigaea]
MYTKYAYTYIQPLWEDEIKNGEQELSFYKQVTKTDKQWHVLTVFMVESQ